MSDDKTPRDQQPPSRPDDDAVLRHELLTPLTGMIGVADLLLSTDLDERQRRYVEGFAAAARGMVSVIGRIGAAGNPAASEDAVDLARLLRGLAAFAEARAAARKLDCTVTLAGSFPAAPEAVAAPLQQALLNLIDNAVKFTDSGSIAVDARLRAGEPPVLVVSVADTGRGIAGDEVAAILENGRRGSGSDDRPGSGIGLGVCADAIRSLGGEIEVHSRLGEGSVFRVVMPLHGARPPLEALAQPEPGGRAGAMPHVLVVEDNFVNRMLVADILGHLGYETSDVADGEQALKAVATTRFDAILMDIEMEGLDGIETTRAIRAMGGVAGSTPVVALTAHGADEPRIAASKALFDDLVAKPIEPVGLDAAIRLALSRSGRRAIA
ncbi:MAG: response regulator [Flavobacteriaceae bacterium]